MPEDMLAVFMFYLQIQEHRFWAVTLILTLWWVIGQEGRNWSFKSKWRLIASRKRSENWAPSKGWCSSFLSKRISSTVDEGPQRITNAKEELNRKKQNLCTKAGNSESTSKLWIQISRQETYVKEMQNQLKEATAKLDEKNVELKKAEGAVSTAEDKKVNDIKTVWIGNCTTWKGAQWGGNRAGICCVFFVTVQWLAYLLTFLHWNFLIRIVVDDFETHLHERLIIFAK